jgi:hypothetical protein
MDADRLCLLEICPPGEGMAQRRVMPVQIEGEVVWMEFEVARVFSSEEEARAYAQQHGIEDVELAREQTSEY